MKLIVGIVVGVILGSTVPVYGVGGWFNGKSVATGQGSFLMGYVAGTSDALEAIVDASPSAAYLKEKLACLNDPKKSENIKTLSDWADQLLRKFTTQQAASVIISQACEQAVTATRPAVVPLTLSGPPATCDQSLWQHVYHPTRLQVINQCLTVTGTLVRMRPEPDGDIHIQLHLDPQHAGLLNARNIAAQGGNLVLEPICVGHVTQSDAVTACQNFTNTVHIPAMGARVSVTGSYVQDNDPGHGWREIHPVTVITPVP